MNKKGLLGALMFIIFLVTLLALFYYVLIPDYKEFKEYKSFCEDKGKFCYCSLLEGCVFRIQSTKVCSNDGCSEYKLSQDTTELCELADKLNDKKTLIEAGC